MFICILRMIPYTPGTILIAGDAKIPAGYASMSIIVNEFNCDPIFHFVP